MFVFGILVGTSFVGFALYAYFNCQNVYRQAFRQWRERRRMKRATGIVLWLIKDITKQLNRMSDDEIAKLIREEYNTLVAGGNIPA